MITQEEAISVLHSGKCTEDHSVSSAESNKDWLFTVNTCAHTLKTTSRSTCKQLSTSATVLPVEVLRCCPLEGLGGALWSSRPVLTAGLERKPPLRLFPFPPG